MTEDEPLTPLWERLIGIANEADPAFGNDGQTHDEYVDYMVDIFELVEEYITDTGVVFDTLTDDEATSLLRTLDVMSDYGHDLEGPE